MYFFRKNIENIRKFLINNKGVIYLKSNKFYIYEEIFNKVEDNFVGSLYFHNKLLIVLQSYDGYFYTISLNDLATMKYNGYYYDLKNDKNDLLYFDAKINSICKIEKDSIRDLKVRRLGYLIGNSYYDLSDYNDILTVKDSTNLKVLWQLHLSTIGTYLDGAVEKEYKVTKFCGVSNDKLVLVLSNSDMLLLNPKTGEVLQHFKDAYFTYDSVAKTEGSNLYWCLVGKYFTEIDVEKQVVTRQLNLEAAFQVHKPKDTYFDYYVFAKKFVVHNELIYFYTTENELGIFSPQEEKIIWYHKMDIGNHAGNFFTDIQVNDTGIYVLDYSSTLHIFEREK